MKRLNLIDYFFAVTSQIIASPFEKSIIKPPDEGNKRAFETEWN